LDRANLDLVLSVANLCRAPAGRITKMSEPSRGMGLLYISLMMAGMSVSLIAQVPRDKSWQVLQDGARSKDSKTRALAVQSLGLVPGDGAAEKLAIESLKDANASVRAHAATALGQMKGRNAIPALTEALQDKEFGVLLAASSALKSLGDPSAFLVYYALLTGERKSGGGLVEEQKKMLNDPKKMAQWDSSRALDLCRLGVWVMAH
jgi:HEAT repeat protein